MGMTTNESQSQIHTPMKLDMTAEQAQELQGLRKQEAHTLKLITRAERRLRGTIQRLESNAQKVLAAQERASRRKRKNMERTLISEIKPLRTQLHKLTSGRLPPSSALAAIRKRICVLEGRLEA